MISVKCELTIIEANGKSAKKDDPRRVVVTSYETKGCGAGEYVTLHLPGGGSATVRADDLRAAVNSAGVSMCPDDELPF